jgi:hypothetical protein
MVRRGCCARCDVRQRLGVALHPDSEPTTATAALIDLVADSSPRAVQRLLSSPSRVATLRSVANSDEPLTPATLDRLGLGLRSAAGGVVDEIDHDLVRFDTWTEQFLDNIDDDLDRQVIASFASWHHRRRLVRMIELGTLRPFSTRNARQQIRVAAQFLVWLGERDVALTDCRQADLDAWFSSGTTTRAHAVGFLVWARDSRRCHRSLRVPNLKPAMPTVMARHERVALVNQLLHDDSLALADRVAGLLVALYAQPVSRLCDIAISDIDLNSQPAAVVVRVARIELDDDTARLVRQVVQNQSGRNSSWLFPGRDPGRHAAAKTLIERLQRIGVTCSARVAAFHDLASQIPSPVLAELIGYNPNFLADRATALGVPWQRYAALRHDASNTSTTAD